ncbi:MAG: glycosyltransferase [Deltaproteobacteria bacterium]|nr:glycosyltransferase [Deltaproteobacteria bacterium]
MTALRLAAGFLRMQPNLLHKDVGQLPLHLSRELGWPSDLVYWMEEDFDLIVPPDYSRWVRRVPVSVSPSRARHTLMFLNYVRRHARSIDVLLVYHLTSESLFNIALYKALNPRGVAVLKLDMDHRALVGFEPSPLLSKRRALMKLFASSPVDLLTIETEWMYERLLPHVTRMGHELHVLPIGVDCEDPIDIQPVVAAKENVVLTAGRLGTVQKNAEQVLEAIERLRAETLGDWQFWFVGTRSAGFDDRLARLLRRRPEFAARIQTRDFVSSREELSAIYRRARVFCLTSRWESFGIVLAEAAYNGCYLVSTDVGAAPELTDRGQQGQLVPVEDAGGLAQALERIITGSVRTESAALWAHSNVKTNYNWPKVARRLGDLVDRCRSRRSTA